MLKPAKTQHQFYGTTTLGEKGQTVIPAEARIALGLKKGEKLLVFSMGKDMLTLVKFANVKEFAERLESKLKELKTIIKHNKRK